MPTLALPDVDLHYQTRGDGPALLFCSATATHGDVWNFFQVPEFSRDHRVVTFDQRGTGKSSARSNDYSNGALAADAAALLDHLGIKSAIVCGHSNGGRVAQRLTVERPDLVGKLILLSSGGAAKGGGIPLTMCLELVEQGYEPWTREQAILHGFTRAYARDHATDMERFLAVRLSHPPSLEIYLRHVIGREAFNMGARVGEIKAPTLVLVGDDEGHGPPGGMTHLDYARQLARDIPNARLVTLPDQGHYYYFSAPDAMHRAMRDFLAST